MKILNIINGWYKFLFKKRSQMANERLKICYDCELRKGVICGVCFCELHAKAEIKDEDCPHPKGNKWVGMHLWYGK